MNITVSIALFGWVPLALLLFAALPPRRAILANFIIGWLFLPEASFVFSGVPNVTKAAVTSYAALLGVAMFDPGRLLSFRLRAVDIPMLVRYAVPMASSLANGLGAYDGTSAVFDRLIAWGVPYLMGRLYFSDLESLRELAVAVFLGGLIYVPLCLYEVRMSPQLHHMVYGFHQHSFAQTQRFGGWRPVVFLPHGLALGMWLTVSSLVGLWLWQSGAVRRLWNVPMSALVPVLLGTALLCKSLGALALLACGVGLLAAMKWTRTAAVIVPLIIAVPTYLTARLVLGWNGQELVEMVAAIDKGRADSLHVRLFNEERITTRAMQKPLFGWGSWGDYREVDDHQGQIITDSFWIITVGQNGTIGLAAGIAMMLTPVVMLLRRTRMRHWTHPSVAAVAGLAVAWLMFVFDSMFNFMPNAVLVLSAGAVCGACARAATWRRPAARPAWPQQQGGIQPRTV
jgi:hypothetical protein